MPALALVDWNGRVLSDTKDTPTPSPEVEVSEEPLHIVAARQHAKDSTKKDTNKVSEQS
jgi:hypothetical protein